MEHALTPRQAVVAANRILADKGVLDAFGHVSLRDPDEPDHFLIARSMAPMLVTERDILCLDRTGEPVPGSAGHSYLERFIHAEIYRARRDVQAIVHSHAPAFIPFGVTDAPLRPLYHMAAGLGPIVPVFEIRDCCGEASDLLIRTPSLGKRLADTLDTHAAVLMRGHGATIVGDSLPQAVFNAVYAVQNAQIQAIACHLGAPKPLTPGECAAAAQANAGQIVRAWELWLREIAA